MMPKPLQNSQIVKYENMKRCMSGHGYIAKKPIPFIYFIFHILINNHDITVTWLRKPISYFQHVFHNQYQTFLSQITNPKRETFFGPLSEYIIAIRNKQIIEIFGYYEVKKPSTVTLCRRRSYFFSIKGCRS